ncbi:2-amino-4-hydroxy-6-hydroxymethyldihydropteridine diphosphokinase [Pelagerythrobacter marinus]|uniref:2-amino-4-hydroxy-6- hydroxymethyldihydropteridine diphosphokinase n=1 Tax=Pelagerythrobacter marinus TaxID=538382 RepID=UPI00203696E2|nr:2-amino-4-hydroxy-6-hydroxymethyldihydropteridine diphosphokinase [Pelagerythrobacter marinus]MEC9067373.1 2-amino-4-hydroxy-6-hydroxymethyldihydropteridine diphosphokinase [Pseudomonadota bacterium]USA39510.1 2-amino-4-hydroxy-6-hydroxymethyldihydropteridine diphosphokinase [Pelagerythrobacter marinus]WPZ06350.1 2-amino-4-hydroxy-6-hydroxymethyldihydropteridine diphosphokinase [Pelagerythrobacter marinus]
MTDRPARHRYIVALGSNVRHSVHGPPRAVLAAALDRLARRFRLLAASPVIVSAPLGPSRRRYANGAALVAADIPPPAMLAALQDMERAFGRRRRGQRWGARVLDLDLVLWSGGAFTAPGLVVPHRAFRGRPFVTGPAAAVAPAWRDPVTGLTLRQLDARLTRPRPLPS